MKTLRGRRWASLGTRAGVASAVAGAALANALPATALRTTAAMPPSLRAGATGAVAVPRAQTLYTSGTSGTAPTDFNPLQPSAAYTGTQGLLYEPLFLYDPVGRRFIGWLATSGAWVGTSTYRIRVRAGAQWARSPSGSVVGPLTGKDVAFSINLARRLPSAPYHADVAGVNHVAVLGDQVTVSFARPVNYAAWEDFLWHAPIVPDLPGASGAPFDLSTAAALASPNRAPVSSGPMLLYATSDAEACYQDNAHWWGWSALHVRFSFRYLCDVRDGPSGEQLTDLLDNRIDWSNALLRGVPALVGDASKAYGIKTYFPDTPYMLASSTAWLEMDTARAPMSSVDFRRAVAAALDPSVVISGAYMGAVRAAGPTGLLPNLAPFVNGVVVRHDAVVRSAARARGWLDGSGYHGQALTLEVTGLAPDLTAAAGIMVKQLLAVGIKARVAVVSPGQRQADMETGHYDMVIDTGAGLSASPWDYFARVFALPIRARQSAGLNLERFYDPSAWKLVQRAATLAPGNPALLSVYSRLEADFLEEVPEVPVWFEGAWFQANTTHWQGYPSSTAPADHYTPVMWPGWLGSTTTVLALAALRPR